MRKQKILSTKSIFHGPLFDVFEQEIEINNNVVRMHFNVQRRSTVHVIALDVKDTLYLVKQYRYNLGKEVVELVAGYIEDDEAPLAAAKRELQEETGLTAAQWQKIHQVELGGGAVNGKTYFFLAQDLTKGKTNFDEGEDLDLVIMPFTEAYQKVLQGEFTISATMLGILLVDGLRRNK